MNKEDEEGDCFVSRLFTIGNVDANRGIVRNPLRDNSCLWSTSYEVASRYNLHGREVVLNFRGGADQIICE